QFYRDILGMEVLGGTLNVGTVQEHLDNVFGARVRVTGIGPPARPPNVEFLQYETPPGGRAMPLDTRANDLWHWQTQLVVDDVDAVAKWLRKNNVRFVSDQVRTLPDDRLGFSKGIMVLDPDGHAMLIVEK
ncbi:MAG: VOC family protein, partial [Candidatus Binatia bacterium]